MDLGIVALALLSSNWLVGIFAYHCFALASVYLVFWDGPKALAAHNTVVLATIVAFIAINAGGGGIVDAPSARIIFAAAFPVAVATVILLIGIQMLRNDANRSTVDPLTGVLNRRGLHLHLRGLTDRPRTPGHLITIVVADLDQFKSVNDHFGHAVGDSVLIRSAQRIRTAVSSNALVARTGGEEFVIIDITAPDQSIHVAEAIRDALNATEENPAVTASLGVYICQWPQETHSDDDLGKFFDNAIARADEAMFQAKRNGGNMISRYPQEARRRRIVPKTLVIDQTAE